MTEQNDLDGWDEIKGNSIYWKPENEGDSVEGVIINIDSNQYGLSVTLENNKEIIVLPSHKVLQNRLKECAVGEFIKVIFEKKELPTVKGQNPTFIYKVLRKKL